MSTVSTDRPRERLGDERALLATGIVLSAVMVAMSLTSAERVGTRPIDLFGAALLVVAYASLAACRRHPIVALLSTLATTSVWFIRDHPGALPAPALLVAIFFVTVSGDRRRTVVACAIVIAPVVPIAIASGEADTFATTAGIIGWMVAAALLGEAVRGRIALTAEYEHRTELQAAELRSETERRVAEVRLGIARDLHDVLAHTVTAMGIQAAVAAEALDSDRDAVATALTELRRQARRAVDDVRLSIESLRADTPDGTIDGVPGLDGVSGLVDQARRNGFDVTFDGPGDTRDVPEVVGISAYRIVQEALTNVLRHSRSSTATVTIGHTDTDLSIHVTDSGPARPAPDAAGFGLVGMYERASAVGGQLSARPTDDGGFEVSALLPTGESTH